MYRGAVARGFDHVGRKFFFDKGATRRKTVAPPFRFESERIDRRAGVSAAATRGGELIVDYATNKVYLKVRPAR